MTINERNELLVKVANTYFERNGINSYFEVFFEREETKTILHTKYKNFEDDLKTIISKLYEVGFSNENLKDAQIFVEKIIDNEKSFVQDVKNSIMVNMFDMFMDMEKIVKVEGQLLNPFKSAFISEDNQKLKDTVNEISDGVINMIKAKAMNLIFVLVGDGNAEDLLTIFKLFGRMSEINEDEIEKLLNNNDDSKKEE